MKRRMQFRTPEEIGAKEKTEQVSTRIKVSALDVLKQAAEKQGESVSYLAGRILEDYVEWLEKEKK